MKIKSCLLGPAATLGGVIATLVLTTGATKASTEPNHWIIQWDVSGSMYSEHGNVKRDIQKFVAALPEKDFVSVVIFSGHGQARRVAGPTQCNEAGKKMLTASIDGVRILGVTVFSEGLDQVIATVKSLAGANVRHYLALLTDGCAVPDRWNLATEQSKSRTAATDLANGKVSLSTIGYGNYYDSEFLNSLVTANGNIGVRRHISSISNFGAVIDDIRAMGENTTMVDVDLKVSSEVGKAGLVLRSTPEITKVGDNGIAGFTSVVNGEITLFVALPAGSKSVTLEGTVNGAAFNETYSTEKGKTKAKAPSPEDLNDATLAAASWAYQTGERDKASALIQTTGNTVLAGMVASSYTVRENLSIEDELRRILAVAGVRQRYSNRKHIGEGKAACVVNLLRLLLDEDCTLYIPTGTYQRTGVTTVETGMRYLKSSRMTMTAIQSNQERLNISMKCEVDVEEKVDLNDPNCDKYKPAKRFRNFVIIKDGSLHQDTLEGFLTKKAFETCVEWGVVAEGQKYSDKTIYTLDLTVLPMIIKSWANPKQLGLVSLMQEELTLEVQQKALNKRVAELETKENAPYRPERTEVDGAIDFYEASCYKYELRQPKAKNAALDEAWSVPDAPDYTKMYTEYEKANEAVKKIRKRLMTVRCIKRLIVFAMEMTGNKLFASVAETPVARSANKMEKKVSTDTLDVPGLILRRVTWVEKIEISAAGDPDDKVIPMTAAAGVAAAA